MRIRSLKTVFSLLFSALLTPAFSLWAGQAEPGAVANTRNPVLAPIKDIPGLPRVLLIGDSISMGYTLFVRDLLKGEANVHRIPENGGPTSFGVEKIDGWLAPGGSKWDIIHFNWGLHDIKVMNGKHQVEAAQYEANLRALVAKMKATGAKLIWCSTTPVPQGKLNPQRNPGDEVAFNAIAKKVMDENGIETNDLYSFALPKLSEIQQKANVHFFEKGSVKLAEHVAEVLRAALKKTARVPAVQPWPQTVNQASSTTAADTAAIRYLPGTTTAPMLEKVNEKQFVPFGWKAFEIPPFEADKPAKPIALSWQAGDSEGKPGRLRLTIAVDMREERMIHALSAKTNVALGAFDIRFASNLELFELKLSPEQTRLALDEGVLLTPGKGANSLWILASSTEPALNPHILIDRAASPREEFLKRMNSLACIQQFGWMEGCVLDGLLDLEAVDPVFAKSRQARAHLDLFTNANGDLIYEDHVSQRKTNSIGGIEATLPFAAIAKVFPSHPSLKIAEDFWTRRAMSNPEGLIIDGSTVSTEGAYTVGYPLAVLSKLRKDDKLRAMAFTQLRMRQKLLAKDGGIHQRGKADGSSVTYKNWARGMAWYMLGFARTLSELKEYLAEAEDLRAEFLRAAELCVSLQQEDGLWRCFADDDKSLPDTSGSAGIAAALAIGVNHGLLPAKYLEAARKTEAGVEKYLTPDGFLDGVAQSNKGGEGLQRGSYRVIYQMGMGLYAQLVAGLKQTDQRK